MSTNGFTPIEQAMLDILDDGQPHPLKELHACLYDTMSPLKNARNHVSNIRRKLRPRGRDILVQFIDHKINYRQVRLLGPAE